MFNVQQFFFLLTSIQFITNHFHFMYVDYCIANIDHYGIIYNIDFAGIECYAIIISYYLFFFFYFHFSYSANNVLTVSVSIWFLLLYSSIYFLLLLQFAVSITLCNSWLFLWYVSDTHNKCTKCHICIVKSRCITIMHYQQCYS